MTTNPNPLDVMDSAAIALHREWSTKAEQLSKARAAVEAMANTSGPSGMIVKLFKNGVPVYEFDFGEEGKEQYVRLNDVCRYVASEAVEAMAGKVGVPAEESDFDRATRPAHGDDAGDGMRFVLCKVGFDGHYKNWLLIPHADGTYVTAATLQPFSMRILRYSFLEAK